MNLFTVVAVVTVVTAVTVVAVVTVVTVVIGLMALRIARLHTSLYFAPIYLAINTSYLIKNLQSSALKRFYLN